MILRGAAAKRLTGPLGLKVASVMGSIAEKRPSGILNRMARFADGYAHPLDVAGLGVLAALPADTLQAHVRSKDHEDWQKKSLLGGEVGHAIGDIAGLGILAAPSLGSMRLHGFKGASDVSDAEAERALRHLEQSQQQRPSADQAVRYGAIGALSNVGLSALGNVIEGSPAIKGTGVVGKLRGAARPAVQGGLAAATIPYLRAVADNQADTRTLRAYIANDTEKKAAANPLGRAASSLGTLSRPKLVSDTVMRAGSLAQQGRNTLGHIAQQGPNAAANVAGRLQGNATKVKAQYASTIPSGNPNKIPMALRNTTPALASPLPASNASSGVISRGPAVSGGLGTLSPPTLAAGPGYVPSQMAELRNADLVMPSFPKNPRIPDRKTLRSAGLAALG